jgi:hypothetical protein
MSSENKLQLSTAMRRHQFENTTAVREFLLPIFLRCGQPFDPAQDMGTLTNSAGQLAFPGEEGAALESAMQDCYLFCIYNNLDVYRLLADMFAEAGDPHRKVA